MKVSRRRFLIGTSAVAVTAGAGIGALDLVDHSEFQRGLRHFGLTSSPDSHVSSSGAIQHSGTLASRYMRSSVAWTLSRPQGDQPLAGIIFCLHGRGADHRFAFDTIHVPDVAASVGLRVAVAAVDGGDHSYWHKRNDGTDALSMFLEEFVPMIRQTIGALPQALMGWSMGGYGALLAAERDHNSFVAVTPASPALWLAPGATAPGAFDSPSDFYANDILTGIEHLRGMTVAVACGTSDPFYTSTRHLVAQMDYPHTALFGPGYHDAAYWRSAAPGQLRALLPALT